VRTRVPLAALFPIVLVLLLGFLAGCGGGEGQSGNGGSQGGGEQAGSEQGGEKGGEKGGEAAEEVRGQEKVALGSIESVQPDERKVVLKPSFEAQGGDQITFKVRKNAEIQVNDQEAELSDIQPDQQAQIKYVTKNEVNRALAVQIVGG